MIIKKAMKATGLKYFSQLTAKQKDTTVQNMLIMKHGLSNLPRPFALQIIGATEIETPDILRDKIEGCKMFKVGNIWYPLNFKELVNAN
jgi:hypothetical protein